MFIIIMMKNTVRIVNRMMTVVTDEHNGDDDVERDD